MVQVCKTTPKKPRPLPEIFFVARMPKTSSPPCGHACGPAYPPTRTHQSPIQLYTRKTFGRACVRRANPGARGRGFARFWLFGTVLAAAPHPNMDYLGVSRTRQSVVRMPAPHVELAAMFDLMRKNSSNRTVERAQQCAGAAYNMGSATGKLEWSWLAGGWVGVGVWGGAGGVVWVQIGQNPTVIATVYTYDSCTRETARPKPAPHTGECGRAGCTACAGGARELSAQNTKLSRYLSIGVTVCDILSSVRRVAFATGLTV
jgi:hypothetical protein